MSKHLPKVAVLILFAGMGAIPWGPTRSDVALAAPQLTQVAQAAKPNGDVHVVLSCDKVKVSLRDSITIDVSILNYGPNPVYLYRIMGWGYGGGLVLHVRDEKGQPVEPALMDDTLLLPPEHEDPTQFIRLDEPMFYGARRQLLVRDKISSAGKYILHVEYWCPLSRHFFSAKLRSLPILWHEDPSLYSNKVSLEVVP